MSEDEQQVVFDSTTNLDILSKLPAELSEYVLSFLSAKDLCSVARVSKPWNDMSNSDFLWKNLCLAKEIEDEILSTDLVYFKKPEEKEKSRWSMVYRNSERMAKKWAEDSHAWLSPDNRVSQAWVSGIVMVVERDGGVTLFCIDGDELIPFQNITTEVEITFVAAFGNTVICDCHSVIFVYIRKGNLYYLEAVLVPLKELSLSYFDRTLITEGESSLNTLIATDNYIWLSSNVIGSKVYNRVNKTYTKLELKDMVYVIFKCRYVAVLRPSAVQLHSEDGTLLHKLSDCAFYTGLVMSTTGIAFLQCQDFCDPEAVYVDLKTKSRYVENKLKVYKLELHKDNLLFLTGQNQFNIVSQNKNVTNWTTPLVGSKYLRPGKDIFRIICSKFIFVCPSLGRLDMFSLLDLSTGLPLYNTCINTSTYNILHISNTGLLVMTKQSVVKLRSYV